MGLTARDKAWRQVSPASATAGQAGEGVGVQESKRLDGVLLRMALDCAPLAVFLLNRHGYLLVAAGGALRHFDIDAGTAVGRPMVELLGDDNVTRDRVARALAGEPVEWSMVIGRQRLDLRFSAWPQDTDVPAVIVGVASESAVGPRG